MKNLLKLYKMFYRLLRLKSYQRAEIERKALLDFYLFRDNLGAEKRELEQKLYQWEHMAKLYAVNSPDDFHKLIADLTRRLAEAQDTPSNWNRLCERYNKLVTLKQEFCRKFADVELGIEAKNENLNTTP